jgi:hypothetical protein
MRRRASVKQAKQATRGGNDRPRLHSLSSMRWPPWHPRSLRRLALREKAKLEGAPRRARVERSLRTCVWKLFHDRGWALLLAVPAIGVAFVPTGLSLNPLEGEEEATAILEILWQVEAAALALSLAVVIFILQAVHSTRRRPSLRGLAERIALPAIFYAGVYGLVLTGMVLMGAGQGAPAGWAATWAVVWAVLSAAGLIFLFVRMLAEIEPDALYRRWLATVELQVQRIIENEIFERLAAGMLRNICREVGLTFQPVFGSESAPHLAKVRAKSSGAVRDIDLWRLRKAGRLANRADRTPVDNPEKSAVLVHLGADVHEGNPVMLVPTSVGEQVRLGRAFKIEPFAPEVEFDATLGQLHDEALRTIREASPRAYAAINEVYERLLLTVPETWAKSDSSSHRGSPVAFTPSSSRSSIASSETSTGNSSKLFWARAARSVKKGQTCRSLSQAVRRNRAQLPSAVACWICSPHSKLRSSAPPPVITAATTSHIAGCGCPSTGASTSSPSSPTRHCRPEIRSTAC